MYNAANNASSQLATSIGAEDTSLAVLDGSSFPEPPFVVSIEDEIIEVRAKNGNTFSALVRGTEGTTPASHASGSRVENRFTAGTYQQVVSELDAHMAKNVFQQEVHGLYIEEGSWTPFLGGIDATYSEQRGYYLRVANMVFLEMVMVIDTKAQGSLIHARIGGIPFTSTRSGGEFLVRPIGGFTLQSDKIAYLRVLSLGSAYLYQSNLNGSGLAMITTDDIPDGGGLRAAFSYSI